jgi:hypothetical protein
VKRASLLVGGDGLERWACGGSSCPGVDQAGGGRAGLTYVQQYADAKTAVVREILARAQGGGSP